MSQSRKSRLASTSAELPAAIVIVCIAYGALFLAIGLIPQAAVARWGVWLLVEVDLTQCSPSYARLVILQILASLLNLIVGLAGVTLCVMQANATGARTGRHIHRLVFALVPAAYSLLGPLSDQVFLLGRHDIREACLVTPDRQPLYGSLMFSAGLGILTLVLAGIARRAIQNPGTPPPAPPVAADAQPDREFSRAAMRRVKKETSARLLFHASVYLTCVGILLMVSVLRYTHNLTWTKHEARIVAVSTRCTHQLQMANGDWRTELSETCEVESGPDPFTMNLGKDAKGVTRRILVMPTVVLDVATAGAAKERVVVRRDVFMPHSRPMGTELTILRDPGNPQRFDRSFGLRDAKQLAGRVIVIGFGVFLLGFLIQRRLSPHAPSGLQPPPAGHGRWGRRQL